MKLTKGQRSVLEAELNNLYGSVRLICDGRAITLQVQRYSALKYRVMTFVDGKFEGGWTIANPVAPEAKFLRKSVRNLFKQSDKKAFEKRFGARAAKSDAYMNKTITIYMPDWPSGKAAINHLCKVCDSVEIAPEKEPTP